MICVYCKQPMEMTPAGMWSHSNNRRPGAVVPACMDTLPGERSGISPSAEARIRPNIGRSNGEGTEHG